MFKINKTKLIDALLSPTFSGIAAEAKCIIEVREAIESGKKDRREIGKTTGFQELKARTVERAANTIGGSLFITGSAAAVAGHATAKAGIRIMEKGQDMGLKIRDIDEEAIFQTVEDLRKQKAIQEHEADIKETAGLAGNVIPTAEGCRYLHRADPNVDELCSPESLSGRRD